MTILPFLTCPELHQLNLSCFVCWSNAARVLRSSSQASYLMAADFLCVPLPLKVHLRSLPVLISVLLAIALTCLLHWVPVSDLHHASNFSGRFYPCIPSFHKRLIEQTSWLDRNYSVLWPILSKSCLGRLMHSPKPPWHHSCIFITSWWLPSSFRLVLNCVFP